MKEQENWIRRLTDAADLRGEPVPRMPLVEMLGDERVLIENHFGITQYSSCEICVKVKFGQAQIVGCHLRIARMTRDQLVIVGKIDGVNLYKGR